MLIVPTYVAPSKISGNGLFAKEAIARGEVVYKRHAHSYKVIPAKEAETLPECVQQFLRHRATLRPDGWYIAWDDGHFINHADEPNLIYDHNGDVIAARNIAAGDELTENYTSLGEIESFPEGDPEFLNATSEQTAKGERK